MDCPAPHWPGPLLLSSSSLTMAFSLSTAHPPCLHGLQVLPTWTRLIYHIDDNLLSFNYDNAASQFKTALLQCFTGTDDFPVSLYIGLYITCDSDSMHMSQEPLALDLLDHFNMLDCNQCTTPMDAGVLLLACNRQSTPDLALHCQYQECIGTLQYLATWTQPDLQFCMNKLSKHMSNPGVLDWQAAKCVLQYLKGTTSLGLTYTAGLASSNCLIAYADADWATCPETRHSISTYVTILNGAAVAWKSKKQGAVATSSSEAEFVSASKAADEIVWQWCLLNSMGLTQSSPTPLYEDNSTCRIMSENPVQTECSKHIDYCVHSLCDSVSTGVVCLVNCASHNMVTDSLTKNLPADAFISHSYIQLGRTPMCVN